MSPLIFAGPLENSIFDINNPYGSKLLTRLRFGLSHLRYHKVRHNFHDRTNPICNCGPEIGTTNQFHPQLTPLSICYTIHFNLYLRKLMKAF